MEENGFISENGKNFNYQDIQYEVVDVIKTDYKVNNLVKKMYLNIVPFK